MELDYICEFVVLANVGGFQKAADELYISQSSLSQHIKRLESQLGAKLFDRSVFPVQLTECGKSFLPLAQQLSSLSHECSRVLLDYTDFRQRNLRIGTKIVDRYQITEAIAAFQALYPDTNVSIMEHTTAELRNMLRKNACDTIIIREDKKTDPEFRTVTYYEDHLVALLPETHPLAKSSKISLKQLQDECFLVVPTSTLINSLCHRLCQEADFQPKMKTSPQSVRTIVSMVQCNLGVSLLTQRMVSPVPERTAVIELEHTLPVYVNFLFSNDLHKADAGHAFLNFMKNNQWVSSPSSDL